jgi:hypothetical protein
VAIPQSPSPPGGPGNGCSKASREGSRLIGGGSERLYVPLSEYPVYITTDELDVVALKGLIAGAAITVETPINAYALALGEPADKPQTLRLRVQNQTNAPVKGTILLSVGDRSAREPVELTLLPAQLTEVALPWPGTRISPTNQYGISLRIRTDAGSLSQRQIVSVARFVKKTITPDGALEDWAGTTPVLLDSDQLKTGVDLSQYLANPHLERPTGTAVDRRVMARVYTAYDDANVYLAAAVHEEDFSCTAGSPVVFNVQGKQTRLPYANGMPDGLNHVRFAGDSFSFAFGFRDRVPDWGRPMNDPWAWKGHFYDTDYHYVAHTTDEGPVLMRQWGPRSPSSATRRRR